MQDISRYIEQLIEEIQEKTNKLTVCPPVPFAETGSILPNDCESMVRETKSLALFTGIETIQLPPHGAIDEDQASGLIDAIMELLASIRVYSDYPNLLPPIKRYKLIREYWDEEITLVGKEHHIDFCHYSLDECPYQGYCTICDEMNDD